MRTRTLAVAAATALALGAFPTSAEAAETEAADLLCSDRNVSVTGFGRGQVLHVVNGTESFIVTSAVNNETRQTLMDIPGQRNRTGIVTCTTTTPAGTNYTFTGFFTPA
jgi:hypothetical protein